jgi:hypothetical protein
MGDDNDEGRGYSWTRAEGNDDADEEEEVMMEGVDDLPLFANEANKELDAKVKEKEIQLEAAANELKEHQSRVAIMSEHLKNVQQELLHTQVTTLSSCA